MNLIIFLFTVWFLFQNKCLQFCFQYEWWLFRCLLHCISHVYAARQLSSLIGQCYSTTVVVLLSWHLVILPQSGQFGQKSQIFEIYCGAYGAEKLFSLIYFYFCEIAKQLFIFLLQVRHFFWSPRHKIFFSFFLMTRLQFR